MDLSIRGNGLTVTDELRDFATSRVSKLDRLIDRVVDAKLELRANHHRAGPDTVTAQLTIQTGRRLLRAEEHDRDASAAVDRAVDKLTRQVRRFHEKRSDRKGPSPDSIRTLSDILQSHDDALATDDELLDDTLEVKNERSATLVRTKRFSLKPMDIEEAIEQMELLNHDFYLFQNPDEVYLNVVYRRRDGSYGLLAPEQL